MEKHVSTGIRKVLESPVIFNFFNNYVIGAKSYVKKYSDTHFNNNGVVKLLDIGCGTCEMLKYLDNDIEYYGFDMQEEYIEHSKNEFKDRGNFYTELVGGEIKSQWVEHFDIINAHGLIHHLSDEDSESMLNAAKQYLKPGGFMLTVDSVYHDNQGSMAKWLVSKDRGQNIRRPNEYLELASKYFKVTKSYISTDHLNIPYSIFTMRLEHKD